MPRTLAMLLTAATTSTVLVAGAVAASPATAQQAGGDGNTRVALAPRVAKIVTNAGITATPLGDAKAFPFMGTLALRFPISGAAGGGNRISHSGGVELSAGHASISLSQFRINLRQNKVSAAVNHDGRAKVFKIKDSNRLKLGPVRLVFNATSAKALNSTFGVDVFEAGNNFGFARVNPS